MCLFTTACSYRIFLWREPGNYFFAALNDFFKFSHDLRLVQKIVHKH